MQLMNRYGSALAHGVATAKAPYSGALDVKLD